MTSIPDQVRQAAAAVMAEADFVRIHATKIPSYTKALLAKYPVVTTLDPANHFIIPDNPEQTAAYVLALDSINFGSGYFKVAQEAEIPLEYTVIAGALKEAFLDERLDNADKWSRVSAADCHDVFNVPVGRRTRLDELMRLFALHLNETGRRIESEYGGKVLNLLEACGNSAVALVEQVATWPTFADVAVYKGRAVPVFKRAQILAADMYLALQGAAPAGFTDMNALTIFSDNMVAHVLHSDGLVEYAPALQDKIFRGVPLDAGSPEETEIRAAAIHAVELMKNADTREGIRVNSVNLDHILWNRGYEAGIYEKPAHRTFSVWY